jgi:hypothetical protein
MINTMNAALYILVAYCYLCSMKLLDHPYVEPFRYGILVWGAFVFYLAVLINSSPYSLGERNGSLYWSINFFSSISLLAGVAASSFSQELQLLSNMASVFSLFYICQKYWEVDWTDRGVALTFFGLIIYGSSFWLRSTKF